MTSTQLTSESVRIRFELFFRLRKLSVEGFDTVTLTMDSVDRSVSILWCNSCIGPLGSAVAVKIGGTTSFAALTDILFVVPLSIETFCYCQAS